MGIVNIETLGVIVWVMLYHGVGMLFVLFWRRICRLPVPTISLLGSGYRCFRWGDTWWTVGRLPYFGGVELEGGEEAEWQEDKQVKRSVRDLDKESYFSRICLILSYFLGMYSLFALTVALSGHGLFDFAQLGGYFVEFLRGNAPDEAVIGYWENLSQGHKFIHIGAATGLLVFLWSLLPQTNGLPARLIRQSLPISMRPKLNRILAVPTLPILAIAAGLLLYLPSALFGIRHTLILILHFLVVGLLVTGIASLLLSLVGSPLRSIRKCKLESEIEREDGRA